MVGYPADRAAIASEAHDTLLPAGLHQSPLVLWLHVLVHDGSMDLEVCMLDMKVSGDM